MRYLAALMWFLALSNFGLFGGWWLYSKLGSNSVGVVFFAIWLLVGFFGGILFCDQDDSPYVAWVERREAQRNKPQSSQSDTKKSTPPPPGNWRG